MSKVPRAHFLLCRAAWCLIWTSSTGVFHSRNMCFPVRDFIAFFHHAEFAVGGWKLCHRLPAGSYNVMYGHRHRDGTSLRRLHTRSAGAHNDLLELVFLFFLLEGTEIKHKMYMSCEVQQSNRCNPIPTAYLPRGFLEVGVYICSVCCTKEHGSSSFFH